MGVALLTHGGEAGFNPRIRLPGTGDWDWIKDIALLNSDRDLIESDLAGNPKGKYGESYGMGCQGGRSFLVFRQLQAWEQNRSREYPYSLLLDIGEEEWERLSWNAALLAAYLSAEGEGAIADGIQPLPDSRNEARQDRVFLLRHPEGITDEVALRAICQRVVTAALLQEERSIKASDIPGDFDDSAVRLRQIWAGALLEESPVEIPFSMIGIARRPAPSVLAGILVPLPVCMRVGFGWLLGLPVLAREIEARLTLTEAPCKTSQETVERIAMAGQQLLKGWEAALSHPAISHLIAHVSEMPFWGWKQRDVPAFLSTIRVLGALKIADGWTGDAELAAANELQPGWEFQGLFEESLDALLIKSRESLGPAGTRYVLRSLPSRDVLSTYGPGILSRQHPGTFLEEIVRTGVPEWVCEPELAKFIPTGVLPQVWFKRAAGAFPEGVLPLVKEALSSPGGPQGADLANFLEKALESCHGRRQAINGLIETVMEKKHDIDAFALLLLGRTERWDLSLENMQRLAFLDGWRALACLKAMEEGRNPENEDLEPQSIPAEHAAPGGPLAAFWEEAARLLIEKRREGREAEFRWTFRQVFGPRLEKSLPQPFLVKATGKPWRGRPPWPPKKPFIEDHFPTFSRLYRRIRDLL